MEAQARSAPALRRAEILGSGAVIVAGSLWHFAYAWSGDSSVMAAIAPVNESVWEHLKLLLVPLTVLGLVETRWAADRRRLWWAKLVEVVAASTFVVAFFYTYTGAFGVESIVAVDIASFVAAVAGGQWLSYRILTSSEGRTAPMAVSVTSLVLLWLGFGVLTFAPPHLPLFRDAVTNEYGRSPSGQEATAEWVRLGVWPPCAPSHILESVSPRPAFPVASR